MNVRNISRILVVFCLYTIIVSTPSVHAASYSITVRDVEITPSNADIDDTLNIKVNYRVDGSDPKVILRLYVDGTLEKTYTKTSVSSGIRDYTFYYDTSDLDGRSHDIKIRAAVYDDDVEKDTDTFIKTIYLNDDNNGGTYSLDIKEITITPEDAHVKDTVDIKVTFFVEAPEDPTVKLYLYIDGDYVSSHTADYNRGSRYIVFRYSTTDLDKGIHTAKIKGEMYKDSRLIDTDTETQSFNLLEKRDIIHNLEFTKIAYNTPVIPAENIPVTVTVKNSGNIDEESVRIKIILDDKTIYSTPFYLARDRSETKTLYIEAPAKSGKYDMVIVAYDTKTERKSIQRIEIYRYSLSLEISPKDEAFEGDWIKISGTARLDTSGISRKLNVYLDDKYEKTIISKEDGTYSDYVKFDTKGYHKITVELENIRKDKIIIISKKETTIPAGAEKPQDSSIYVSADGKPYTIIIIKEGKDRIYIDGNNPNQPEDNKTKEIEKKLEDISNRINSTDKKIDSIRDTITAIEGTIKDSAKNIGVQIDNVKSEITRRMNRIDTKIDNLTTQKTEEEDAYKYVDIETSNKELVVSNYGSNIVAITITNHLGYKSVFSIDTDFSDKWVFLPASEEIKNKETKTLNIYFNPVNASGEFMGNITIYSGNETVKKIPLTLFVVRDTKKTEDKPKSGQDFFAPLNAGSAIFLFALFAIVMIFLYYRKGLYASEDKRPLEPKIIPHYIGKPRETEELRSEKKPIETPKESILKSFRKYSAKTSNSRQIYHVGWEQVIL